MKQKTRRAVTVAALGLATCVVVAMGASSSVAGTLQSHPGGPHLVRHAPGYWTELAKTLGATFTGTPAVWLAPDHSATILWERHIHNTNYTYEEVLVDAAGTVVGAPVSIFGGTGWLGLVDDPVLVSDGSTPEIIFSGGRDNSKSDSYSKGCVYGAVEAKPQWTMQGWSLSNDCYNPIPGGTETKTGVLSAAWGGSSGGHSAVLYRIGTSPTIPATGTDDHVLTAGGGDIGRTAEAADIAGNDNVYVSTSRTPRAMDRCARRRVRARIRSTTCSRRRRWPWPIPIPTAASFWPTARTARPARSGYGAWVRRKP